MPKSKNKRKTILIDEKIYLKAKKRAKEELKISIKKYIENLIIDEIELLKIKGLQ